MLAEMAGQRKGVAGGSKRGMALDRMESTGEGWGMWCSRLGIFQRRGRSLVMSKGGEGVLLTGTLSIIIVRSLRQRHHVLPTTQQ